MSTPPSTDLWMFTLAQVGAKPTDGVATTTAAAPTTGTSASASPASSPSPAPTGGFGNLGIMPVLVLAFLAVMIIPQLLAGKKQKKQKEALLSSLGKGDRVLTIGGQIGIVDQVRDQEIVLRIDENSNAKARFTKASIQAVLDSVGKPATDLDTNTPTVEVKAKSDNPIPAR